MVTVPLFSSCIGEGSLYRCSLPASEKGEVQLSRLPRTMGEDTSITNVADYHNTFVTLCHQQPGTRKPLTSSQITRETVRAVSMHLTRLLACIQAGTVPFVERWPFGHCRVPTPPMQCITKGGNEHSRDFLLLAVKPRGLIEYGHAVNTISAISVHNNKRQAGDVR